MIHPLEKWLSARRLEFPVGFDIEVHWSVDRISSKEPSFAFKKSDTKDPTEVFYRMISPYGTIAVHRADFLNVLVDKLPKAYGVHFNRRLLKFTQESDDGQIALHFSDGSTAQADILIGADGVKSATRQSLYQNLSAEAVKRGDTAEAQRLQFFIHARWTGTYIYRGIVEADKLLKLSPGHPAATVPLVYLGKDKHVVSYPISHGKLINFGTFISKVECEGEFIEGPTVVNVTSEETIEPFTDWEPEVQALLKCVDNYSRWAVCQMRGLPHNVAGRVALLGDAAHAMTTHIGAGAGQAIEDAYILGQLLANELTNKSNLETALRVYEDIRLPIGNAYVEHSRLTGLAYEFNYTPESIVAAGVDPNSPEGMKLFSEFIYDCWAWHWGNMPDTDWQRAKEKLHDVLSDSSHSS